MVSAVMMRNLAINRRRRTIAACFLLGMLLLRAYVPVGFMPASGSPFLLELCPSAGAVPINMDMDGHMDMSMDPHMDMSVPVHQHGHFDHCPFGSAPVAGPLSQFVAFDGAGPIPSFVTVDFQSLIPSEPLERAHPPRGPPALA